MQERVLLLVEDDPIYAEFIVREIAAAALPFRVHGVSSVGDALAYLAGELLYGDRVAHPLPSIVLLDLNLGGESGFAVLRWLASHEGFGWIRTVVLTASDGSKDIQDALRLGAASFLVKSYSAYRVVNQLQRIAMELGRQVN